MDRHTVVRDGKPRCRWCKLANPLYVSYHDTEWGRPVRSDDHKMFEMLLLEMFQAGLSWECVLNKREAFREAFNGFDCLKVAVYGPEKIDSLCANPAIIRNRLKIKAAVTNAQVFQQVQLECGSFSRYIWHFTGGHVIFETGKSSSALSDAVSADLKRRGMKFVGTKIVYSLLQATGVINSHEEGCWLHQQLDK